MDETDRLQAEVTATEARYIRLGAGGCFARECIDGGYVGLDFRDVPHEACLAGDWAAVREQFLRAGKSAGTASRHVKELEAFYTLGADALWITFAEGRMWWAMAEPTVTWTDDARDRLPRRRRVIGAWRSANIRGEPLLTRDLSTRFTCIAGYKGTLCAVKELPYALRKINGQTDPLIVEAETAQAAMLDLTARLIQRLNDKEFDLLVDLIFAASGWRRVSVLGEIQADVDLIVEQVATGERAFVQVKSRATPAVLEDYVERFRSYPGCSRMFFVCHSSVRIRENTRRPDVDVWLMPEIAEKALHVGLMGWLIDRAR